MTVIRFDPFRDPLERLLSMAATGTRAPLGMPMDVYRAGDGSYHVEADLPGVDPDSVEVTVEHSTLTIRAERTPHYGESEQVIVAERPQGSFTRQLSLGEGVDSENLTADYADGVLHLTIPVSPKTQARRVKITHAPGGSRTISGSTAEQGGAPPAAPAAAEHPPGQAGAGHHGIRAGAGLGPAENDELAATRWRPDGLLSPDGHTRHRRPRRDRCPKPAQAHRIAGVEVLRASTLPRKSCR
jgi:HSP20 family protein